MWGDMAARMCAGTDAGTPAAARVLAEAAGASHAPRTAGALPGAPTPERTASPATAKTPGSALLRAAQVYPASP